VNIIARLRHGIVNDWHELSRAFSGGSAFVEPHEMTFGRDQTTFTPAEYGDYIATSLGVYAAANLRAKLLSSLPLKLYTLKGNGDRDEVTSGTLLELLSKVNPFWTFSRLIEMTELSLCLWGANYWFIERGSRSGEPKELWWAQPSKIKVVPHPTEYVSGFLLEAQNGRDIPYKASDTIWLRYPNPLDQFSGLAPLAAARLSADVATAAMKSNRNLFVNGVQMAGWIGPATGDRFTKEQADALAEQFNQRFKGVDKAHRVGVLSYETRFNNVSFSPKDAEFLGALQWSLEDICRAFGVPLDMLGGQRTYANLEASERIMWANTVKAEAKFLADELTEQLLPMFPGQADLVEFDLSGVDVLKESENESWTRASDQITKGAIVVNEWRAERGLDPVPWGDAWWAPFSLAPVMASTPPEPSIAPAEEPEALPPGEPRAFTRAVAFGSPEHERLYRLFMRRTEPWERKVAEVTRDLMQRQQTAVLARLRGRTARALPDAVDEPFDKPRWIKAFRTAIRPIIQAIAQDSGQNALDDLLLAVAFDVSDPNVIRFLERQAQRFAVEVNDTTWNALKASLAEGLAEGEGIDKMAARVEEIMGDRIRSAGTTIARTETVTASNGGTLLSWEQSGVVKSKTWLAALDERTRDAHIEAHGQTVGLDEDFYVDGESGPGPGMMGSAENDINCRCSMIAGLSERAMPPQNGHKHDDLKAMQVIAASMR
jgi:HK97 family phage portal protein